MPHEGMHSAQFMGLINALRTGDPVVDMVLAFLVPFVVQKLIVHLPAEITKLIDKLLKKKKKTRVCYQRNIVYRSVCNASTNVRLATDEDSFNMYLLRAIHLYTHQHCELSELGDAHLDLTMLDTSKTNSRNGRFQPNNGNNNGSNSIVDLLQTCSLVEKPLENKWLQVGNYSGGGVEIMICDSAANNGGGNKKEKQALTNNGAGGGQGDSNSSKSESTRSLEIKIRSYHSVDSIRTFVKTAFDWYVEEIKKQENKDRFMLDVMPMTGVGGRHGNVPHYVPYKLHDGKTFKTLFNRKCHELLRVVDQFQEKTGKYAIEGYPYKLGLLLSGPPGTGKTSLIKALAYYTNRHMVNINLAHISANSDLRKIFFNKTYQITSPNGAQHYMRLDFNQVIFVLEDVDAGAREVVMDRCMLAEVEKEKAEKKAKKKEEEKNQPAFGGAVGHRPTAGSGFPGLDKLNLSGLLNVLDGVVETPGRMVIMTTNHPEILDPALIRPGRIDKILELGFMEEPDDVVAMIEHYYPGRPLSAGERAKVKTSLTEDRIQITPAQMEQIAMEEETLPGFLDRLSNYNKVKDVKSGIPKRFVIHSPESTDTAKNSDFTPTEDEEAAFALEGLGLIHTLGMEEDCCDYGDY